MNEPSKVPASTEKTPAPYTHGLEAVYAFETIDPLSVRRLQSATPKGGSSFQNIALQPSDKKQHTAMFETDICNNIQKIECLSSNSFSFSAFQPFLNLRFLEPIEILELPSFLVAKLKQKKLFLIEDLDAYVQKEKSLYQGHLSESTDKNILLSPTFKRDRLSLSQIEEISEKINLHTFGGKKTVPFIDWHLLSCLLFMNLNSQQEEDEALFLFSLDTCSRYCQKIFRSSKERLPIEERKKLKQKIKEFLKSIFQAWIAPWITSQEGIIHSCELENYLEELSSDNYLRNDISLQAYFNLIDTSFSTCKNFIAWVFGEKFLFSSHLIPCKDGYDELYCWGDKSAQDAAFLIETIQSYLSLLNKEERAYCVTTSSIAYSIQRELLKKWRHNYSAKRIKEISYFLL